MPKRVLLLAVTVVATAILVVHLRHESRVLFGQLQTLRAKRDALNTEWGQLLLEEGTWSEHGRIERMARTRLDMRLPTRNEVVVVEDAGSVP